MSVKGPMFDITSRKLDAVSVCFCFTHAGNAKIQILVGCFVYNGGLVESSHTFNVSFNDADGVKMVPSILMYISHMKREFKKQMDAHYRPHQADVCVSIPKRRRVDGALME